MSTDLFSYIADDSGILIIYPDIYDKSSVAAAIQSQRNFSGKGFLLVTKSPQAFKYFHSFPNDFFDDRIFCDYQKPTKKKNIMLKNGIDTGVYIIIDDLQDLITAKLAASFKKTHQNTKIIILTPQSTPNRLICLLQKSLPKIKKVVADFLPDPLQISYNIILDKNEGSNN